LYDLLHPFVAEFRVVSGPLPPLVGLLLPPVLFACDLPPATAFRAHPAWPSQMQRILHRSCCQLVLRARRSPHQFPGGESHE
jgi:hypothetical protein